LNVLLIPFCIFFPPSGSSIYLPNEAASQTEERHAASVCFYYSLWARCVSDVGVCGVSNVDCDFAYTSDFILFL